MPFPLPGVPDRLFDFPPHMPMALPSHAQAVAAMRTLLRYIGDDPDRPGLQETPERHLRAWKEWWGVGYDPMPDKYVKVFPHEGASYNQMVFLGNIRFMSFCEHHIAPFYGEAHVAYIADEDGPGLLGLSKLARIVNHHARRLQVQERLTEQIANTLAAAIMPSGGVAQSSVAVQLRALHTCMISRGVQQSHATTVTATLRGKFLSDAKAQDEFLRYCSDATRPRS